MKESIREYLRKCKICQESKTNFNPNKSPMLITTTSKSFCEQIADEFMAQTTKNEQRITWKI